MFVDILPDQFFYRGRNQHNHLHGKWYTHDEDSASGYGNIVGKYQPRRPLRMINLISQEFHRNFIDKLNLEFTGTAYDGFDQNKLLLLLPLGLPDYNVQIHTLSQLGVQSSPIPTNPTIISYLKLVNNISRISDFTLDTSFANKIQEYYGALSDGFVLPLRCLSIPTGGMFHRELFVYDNADMNYIEDVPHPTTGGSQIPNTIPQIRLFKNQDEIKAYVKKMNENHKKLTSALPIVVNEHVVGMQEPIHTNIVEGGNRKKLHKTRKMKK